MNEILSKVTPNTRGIIWLHQGKPSPSGASYKALDYLLNGLLTSSLINSPEVSGRVLLSANFHFPLHIFVAGKLAPQEYESYLKLLKKDLGPESTVLVIDEDNAFNALLSKTPQDLKSLLHLLK